MRDPTWAFVAQELLEAQSHMPDHERGDRSDEDAHHPACPDVELQPEGTQHAIRQILDAPGVDERVGVGGLAVQALPGGELEHVGEEGALREDA